MFESRKELSVIPEINIYQLKGRIKGIAGILVKKFTGRCRFITRCVLDYYVCNKKSDQYKT
jgi:hypothetical protein